jgi:hypothetical protein
MRTTTRNRALILGTIATGILIIALPKKATSPAVGEGLAPPPPVGELVGTVSDSWGTVIPEVTVALFDAESLELVEHVETDVLGRFAFQEKPPSMHVYAQAPEGLSLTGQWVFDLDGPSTTMVDLVLDPGYPVTVHVKDEGGSPVAGAIVRAYDARADLRGNVALKAQTMTDAAGNASLLAPTLTHLAVLAEDQGYMPCWKFRQRIKPHGRSYDLLVREGIELSGRVRSQSFEALEGIVVSAWAYNKGWHWSGYMETDVEGAFELIGGPKWTRIHAVDPDGGFVSSYRWYRTTSTTMQDIVLPEGNPLEVRCVDPDGAPVKSRVWFYSYENRSWSWGGYTDAEGLLHGIVSASYAIVVRPLSKDFIGVNLWRQTHGEPQQTLEMKPARLVDITVSNKLTGELLEDIQVRGYVDNWVYVGRGYTGADGELQLRMPTFGLGRFRVKDHAEDSLIKPGWYTVNLGDSGDSLDLELDSLVEITGRIETLDGQPVTDDIMVTAWDADRWAKTGCCLTSNGEYNITVPERYHLRFRAVDSDSRFFPTYHWWNELPDGGVHARNPARMTQGWFGDVQVRSVESDEPVRGMRIRGGYPRRVTGDDGWAKHMLFRPVYTLRNYPPPVSSQSPNPIIPDLMRVYETIEGDRTVEASMPLEPIKVFTEVGTIAHGKVEGPLPDGGVGPLPGVRVRAYGGRRPLGWTMTDGKGEFSVLAVQYTPEHEFKTSLLMWPDRSKPYLPGYLKNLELTADIGAGEKDDVGTVTLDGAAFGHGRVVDAFGSAITDRTVFYIARRWDEAPHWYLGGWRVRPDGTFVTKVAPRTWFRFLTRFWNNSWENKYFQQEYEYTLGQSLDLGEVEIGKTALVECRAVTSIADADGSGAPVAQVWVEVIDATNSKVYDWGRTDGSGEIQLRAPYGTELRMRFSFWHWSHSFGGVGFDKVTSEFFKPQLSEEFTLTAEKTDFGDVFVTSPLRHEIREFLSYIYSASNGAFATSWSKRTIFELAWAAGRVATPAGQKLETATAKSLIQTGTEMFVEVESLCSTLINDATVREEALDYSHAVLNDFALLFESLEDK